MEKKNPIPIPADALPVEESAPGVSTHTLAKPFTYEGKTYDSFSFDFDKLTGNDALAIENELQSIGKPVIIPSISGDYLVRMAAKACTEPVGTDVFLSLPIREYQSIRNLARSFLLKSEL